MDDHSFSTPVLPTCYSTTFPTSTFSFSFPFLLLSTPPSRIKRFKATDGMTSGFLPSSQRKKNPKNQYTVLVYFHSACMTVTAASQHAQLYRERQRLDYITYPTLFSSRVSSVSSCHQKSLDQSFVVIISSKPHQVVTLMTELCHELLS